MNQRAMKVIRGQARAAAQPLSKVAQEATGEAISRPSWIAHVFERIGWRGEERAIRAEQHRAVAALLDHQHLRPQAQDVARRRAQAWRLSELARLLLGEEQHVYVANDLDKVVARG